ncbi:PPOX class F420-dependent oxidoreductase [Cryptosporangium sp. NPDC048952]|uniref:PPOX class F420-dependent oxidoreductase n=1 Tax=Cryptosporangium sp. NPDC048952 TaxID=3363961 RepID=UPI00371D2106
MGVFSAGEIEYLGGQRLGRLATVTADGRPHVVPTGFRLDHENGILKIGAHDLPGRGQRRGYRGHIANNPWVAFVVDDVATVEPWAPRGVAVKGHAEIQETGGELLGRGFGPLWVRITPSWVSSWGIDNGSYDKPIVRAV